MTKSANPFYNPNERWCPMPRAQVTCPRCGHEHEVSELPARARESVEENAYGEDTLIFECFEGCGEVKGIVWRR
jgi:hypothetical protein